MRRRVMYASVSQTYLISYIASIGFLILYAFVGLLANLMIFIGNQEIDLRVSKITSLAYLITILLFVAHGLIFCLSIKRLAAKEAQKQFTEVVDGDSKFLVPITHEFSE